MEKPVSLRKRLLFGAIFTILLLGLLELSARVVELFSPPYITAGNVTVSKPAIPPKEEGAYRIFVYGGSTVEGLPVRQFSFVSQLEFRLRELQPEKPLELYNFSGRPEQKMIRVARPLRSCHEILSISYIKKPRLSNKDRGFDFRKNSG